MKLEILFNPLLFVSDNQFPITDGADEIMEGVKRLRENYPELSHFSDLAIHCAWMSYSEDYWLVSWYDITSREENFLGYIYLNNKDKDIWGQTDKIVESTKELSNLIKIF